LQSVIASSEHLFYTAREPYNNLNFMTDGLTTHKRRLTINCDPTCCVFYQAFDLHMCFLVTPHPIHRSLFPPISARFKTSTVVGWLVGWVRSGDEGAGESKEAGGNKAEGGWNEVEAWPPL
jgi:hypothetical protein